MIVTLSLTTEQKRVLGSHLFPPDRCEAVAILLCGRRAGDRVHRLVVREVHPIAYDECHERRPDYVSWSTRSLVPLLERANRESLSVVKVHGHLGYDRFSPVDDRSDRDLFASLPGWIDADVPHGSAVMIDDGRIFGRWSWGARHFEPFERIMVVGDTLQIYFTDSFGGTVTPSVPSFAKRTAQAFGRVTTALLRRLTIVVVGCSGTGSPLIEQLVRLGVGRLVLVDPDFAKIENLNRIIHSTMADVDTQQLKVDLLGAAIERIGLGTEVIRVPKLLFDRSVVQLIAESDVVIGCMDSAEGRKLLNRLATFYVLPYIDLGVKLEAADDGEITQVSGAVHYLQPGRSSLLSRGVISLAQAQAEGQRRQNPSRYEELRRERYIDGVDEDRPAVISVNFMVASMAANELLARLHDYRTDGNAPFAEWRVSLSHGAFYAKPESPSCSTLRKNVGRGDVEPLLDDPELSASA